ncbi:MAG: hypothetical protein OEU54_02470 [Gemmatimonadota bacterium]|nr:hypothetical protein [Gemmatimonadota bacterium]
MGADDERFDTVTAAESGERERTADVDRAAEIVADMADATPLRGVAAVVVGFVVLTFGSVIAGRAIASISGPDVDGVMTSAFLTQNLLARFVIAALAGYLTARAAPMKPLLHGVALAGLVAFMAGAALVGLKAAGTMQDPTWYPVAMLFVGPGGVLVGALFRDRQGGRRGPAADVKG